ncbi:MAG: DUF1624 domain-containing protein [Clostridia bacterium]|nr:DUF1624 domain-containing protein [Clostridia bacterium]
MRNSSTHRIFELDFLRGLALILMCLDHLAYDLYCLPLWFPHLDSPVLSALGEFGEAVSFSPWRQGLHYVFATLFLLLAGIGSALTSRLWRRTLQITGAAVAITAGTVGLDLFLDLNVTILFGVLSAIAVGVFFCGICSLFGESAGKYGALILGIAIILVGFSLKWYAAPTYYSVGTEDLVGIVLGTVRYGADWFPLFPCAGVVCVGYFLGKTLYARRQSLLPALRGKACGLCVVGRYSLWIYLLHQPVLAGLLCLFTMIFVRN